MRPAQLAALEGFDSLPNSANVRLPVVAALKGVSPSTVYRMSADGRLPKPRREGRITAWNVGELRSSAKPAAEGT